MRVLIIGCGNMGRAIASRVAIGGHELTLFDVDPGASERLASELGGTKPGGSRVAVAETPVDGVPHSDIVILASWFPANLETASQLGAELQGKVVVEISNPLNRSNDWLVTSLDTSAAEAVRNVLPEGVAVVKAFNTTFAATLKAGEVAGQILDVFIAGDDEQAKNAVATLVRDGKLNPIDVGPLRQARLLEALGLLGITLQPRLGSGFGTAWKLVMPPKH